MRNSSQSLSTDVHSLPKATFIFVSRFTALNFFFFFLEPHKHESNNYHTILSAPINSLTPPQRYPLRRAIKMELCRLYIILISICTSLFLNVRRRCVFFIGCLKLSGSWGGSAGRSLPFSPCLQSIERGGMLCTAICKSGENVMPRPEWLVQKRVCVDLCFHYKT